VKNEKKCANRPIAPALGKRRGGRGDFTGRREEPEGGEKGGDK